MSSTTRAVLTAIVVLGLGDELVRNSTDELVDVKVVLLVTLVV